MAECRQGATYVFFCDEGVKMKASATVSAEQQDSATGNQKVVATPTVYDYIELLGFSLLTRPLRLTTPIQVQKSRFRINDFVVFMLSKPVNVRESLIFDTNVS
uniref:Uncharacterized protein n=1 Tax=Oryza brachyantha TaxID=4533 RepID=J3MJU2_ORYBR